MADADLDREEMRAAGVGVPIDMRSRGGPILDNRGFVVDGGPIAPVVAEPLTRVLFDNMFVLVRLSEDNFLSFVSVAGPVDSLSELLITEEGREVEGVEKAAESRRETREGAGVLVDPPVPRTP